MVSDDTIARYLSNARNIDEQVSRLVARMRCSAEPESFAPSIFLLRARAQSFRNRADVARKANA